MIKKLPNGTWVIQEDTHISQWVQEHGTLKCDPYLFKWLEPKLKDVKVVWDVGANIGDHTRFYLDLGKIVVAVEPNPDAYACLEHNCPEAVLLQRAASDEEGALLFAVSDNAGASRVSRVGNLEVRALRLDLIQLPQPDFIKLDVEGYELHALRGMRATLEFSLPALFVEINRGALASNGFTPRSVTDWLREVGYNNFQIYPPNLTEAEEQYDLYITK